MKILIVDDSSFKRKAIAYVIERHGYRVMVAEDGQDGLEKARDYMPDIIISDLLMPRMDGFNFLKNIKKDEQLSAIPVVIYSATYKEEKVKKLVLSLGASGFIEDMDKPERLWQEVQEIIESGRRKEAQVLKPLIEKDEEFPRNYSHIVAAKLEEKVRELAKSNTERKRAEEELRLLYLLTRDISIAVDFNDAIEVSLKKICEATGWVMGEAWIPASGGSHLECNHAWYGKRGFDSLKKFRKVSEGFSFKPGVGLPGRVWSSKSPVWDKDVTVDPNFPRAPYAIEAGLKAAMAIPVLSGDKVVAVLDFFVTEFMEEDKRQVEFVSAVASNLGILFQRKQIEGELRKLFLAVEQSPVSIFMTDPEGNIEYVNPSFVNITGYSIEEVMGKKPDIISSGTAIMISDTKWRGEFLAKKKNGETYWEYSTISPVINAKGEIINFIGINENITERKMAEEALRENEEKLQRIINGSSAVIFVKDLNGKYLLTNTLYEKLFHVSKNEIIGKTDYDIFPKEAADAFRDADKKALISNKPIETEEIVPQDDGIHYYISLKFLLYDVQGKPYAVCGIATDITERKKAEEDRMRLEVQLIQSQKMDALGRLAGGIAHDFNNALTAILGYSDLLLIKRGEDSLTKNFTEQILAAGRSAAKMVSYILSFSRKQTIIPKPVDFTKLVNNLQKTLLRLIREDIELKIILKDTPLIVKADHTQIEQVLMNLATNARDAMPHGGIITITIETMNIDDRFVKAHGYGVPGSYALLSFADTGVGMDQETKKRIFEPFFTTKEIGKGTGLGLAMVYGIIKQHEGFINVYSEPGKGTTFRIYLPLTESATEAEEVKEQTLPAGGGETILLIEDDERVRKLTVTVLENSGYKVIAAVNGEDGINKFRENKDAINLCVCDMIMPKKGGREFYEEMKNIRSDIKVIFMSGYAADEIKGIIENGMDFISKPVSTGDLLKKVRKMIDRLPDSSNKK